MPKGVSATFDEIEIDLTTNVNDSEDSAHVRYGDPTARCAG